MSVERKEEDAMLSQSKLYAVVPAKDIGRAKEFYRDKLGLESVRESSGGFIYECADGARFQLYETDNAGTARNTAMGWSVEDLELAIQELSAKGVVFEKYDMPGVDPATGIATMGGERAIWFKDSEGNILCLSQMH